MTVQAATVDIKDAVPNGEVNGYPLFVVGSTITVSSSNGSFYEVMIDGIRVAFNQYTNWSSYTIDVSKYRDGDVHRLQLLRGTTNYYEICYFVVDDEEIDGVFYAINGESARVSGAIPEIREAHILSKYTKDGIEYPVTGICNNAFYNHANLSVVSIPMGIQSIGSSAFEGCIQLSEITIPESVTSIGSSAFKGCGALTVLNFNAKNCSSCGWSSSPAFPATISVLTLGDKVTVIPDYFLCEGSRIQNLTIPESVTNIGYEAFNECQRLKSLTIGAGVLTIGSGAFTGDYGRYTIAKVLWLGNTPPVGMTGVKANVNYVANDQYGLSNQVVYQFLSSKFTVDGVVYVPVSPSERTCDVIDCVYDASISEQTISNKVVNKGIQLSVKNINAYSFYDQDNVVKLLISNDGYIGRYAFYDCDKIETLNIANQGDIDERAFYSCGNLETATISNNGNIGESAFRDCTNLETVTIFNQGRIGADAFRSDSNLRNVTLGEKVTDIGMFAFASCSTLPEIVIPNSVKTMGESVFSGCSALVNVTIGNKVSELQRNTFSGCSSLGQISIPNNIASIGDNVFSG